MHMYHEHALCLKSTEEGTGNPRSGIRVVRAEN